MKLHQQEYIYKHTEKRMSDVNEEVAYKVASKLNKDKPFRVMTKDNGRMIVAFLSRLLYKQIASVLEDKNQFGDVWIQYGEEKTFQVGTDTLHTEIVIAEFWTDQKLDMEEQKDINERVRFHFGIKEDTGVYRHPFDVYAPNELL